MIKYINIIIISLVFVMIGQQAMAEKVFEYGFEDWGGDVASTPNYPFTSEYSVTMEDHYAFSEVVTSYDGMSPHSGSYFFLQNHNTVALNPPVSGITTGMVGTENYVGLDGTYGGGNDFDVTDACNHECFVSFWANISDWENFNDDTDTSLKAVRFYDTGGDSVVFYVCVDYTTHDPQLCLRTATARHYGDVETSLKDGSWHKFSLYINYDNGRAAIWYDQTGETWENADVSYTEVGGFGFSNALPIQILDNYSAHNPTGEQWNALDDIEVWNSLPTSTPDITDPEFSSATINGTTATITLTEDVTITDLDDGDFKFTGSTTGEVSINSCTENNGVISGTAASTFVNGETVTCAYSGDANEVEDTSSNSLDTFSGQAVTNNTPAPSATGNIAATVGSGNITRTINPAGNCTWTIGE